MSNRLIRYLAIAVVSAASASTDAAEPAASSQMKIVTVKPLPNAPGNSLTAMTVDVPPGDVSPPHHHAGFVFVYVLTGAVESQLNDQPSHRFPLQLL